MRFKTMAFHRVLCAFALACAVSAAQASLEISPIKIELSEKQPITSLSLTNHKDAPVLIQSEVLRWDIVDGKDVFEPTDEVLFNPPIFELGAGKTQVLRVGLAHPGPIAIQRTYRIFVQEVPNADPIGGGLRIAVRFSVPILAQPSVPDERNLTVDPAGQLQAGILKFRVHNPGNEVTIIRGVHLLDAGSKEIGGHTSLIYVLAGKDNELSVKLNEGRPPQRISVVLDTPRGKQYAQLTLAAP